MAREHELPVFTEGGEGCGKEGEKSREERKSLWNDAWDVSVFNLFPDECTDCGGGEKVAALLSA